MIPTIPGTAQVPDTQIGSKVNVGPRLRELGQVRQTAGAANASIQDAVGAVYDYEQKKQKAEEGYATNMMSLGLQKLHTDYLHKASTMPDDQIVKGWTDTSSQFLQTQLDEYGSKLTPRAKQALSIYMQRGIGEATAKFQAMADVKASQRRNSAAKANSREFLKSGDEAMLPKAKAALDIAVNNQDMTPEERDFEVSQFGSTLQANQIRNGMTANPVETLKKMDDGGYPDVPQNTFLTLRRAVETQINKVKKANYEDIRKNQAKGVIYTKDDLTDLADAGKLEGSSIDTILKAQKGDVTDDQRTDAASRVHDMINRIAPDASTDERLNDIVRIHGSKDYNLLNERQKKDFDESLKVERPPESDSQKDAVEQLRREDAAAINAREAIDRKGGTYLLPDEEITARGGNAKDRIGFSESQKTLALRHEAQLRQWFRDWTASHQNKQPSPEDISQARMNILKPSVTDMVKQALSKPPTE